MKGNIIFLAFSALLGIAAGSHIIFFLLFATLCLYLKWSIRFPLKLFAPMFIIFILFFIRSEMISHSYTKLEENSGIYSISLLHSVKIDGDSFSAYGREERTKEKLVVRYKIPTEEEKKRLSQLTVGTVCRMEGKLVEPNQGRNRNAFDYKKYLQYKQIFWIFSVNDLDLSSCTQKLTPLTFISTLRQKGIDYIAHHFPEETAPLAIALIFGERERLDDDLLDAYQKLGIVHLLAISGLHVGLLVGMIFFILLRLNLCRENATTFLLLFVPFYILITGASPSVVRAGLMVFFVLFLSKLPIRKLQTVDMISIVLVVLLFFQPMLLYNVGFQLSFAVTYALLLSAKIFSSLSHRPIFGLLAVSLVSQVASAPILLYHFYEFSIVSLFLNVVYVPLFSVIILPLMLIFFVCHLLLSNVLNPVLQVFDFYIHLMNLVTTTLSKFPLSTITLGRPSPFFYVFYLLAIGYFFHRWENNQTFPKVIQSLLPLMLVLLFQANIDKFNPVGEVAMIDVGQGDSLLIKLPFQRGTYLIDTGGTFQFPMEEWRKKDNMFEVGEDVVIPYLKSRGIREIDKLILTHGDLDHVGGARSLLENMKVREILLPYHRAPSELEKEIIHFAASRHIPIRHVQAGNGWQVGKFIFRILSPSGGVHLEKNDQSIALYTNMGGLNWLFTGDLEEKGENLLLAEYPHLQVDILKVGHHGSRTSSSERFLDSINPKVALISAGKSNRFGHPHKEVLERLEKRGITIYRTDENGEITIYFRKNRGTFSVKFHTIK